MFETSKHDILTGSQADGRAFRGQPQLELQQLDEQQHVWGCFAASPPIDAAAIGGLKEYNHASKALIGGCCRKHLFRKRKRAGGKFQ
jgi:S-methylmethionine-dependent homocysteine/selenocysteine methylase